MNKKLISIIASGLLIFSTCGCQRQEEVAETKPAEIVEQEVDLEVLEYEYNCIVSLMGEVINVIINNNDLTMTDITTIIRYVAENRIEPTQELTKEFDELIDDFMTTGINYFTTRDELRKAELEEEMAKIFEKIEAISEEIENTLVEAENI